MSCTDKNCNCSNVKKNELTRPCDCERKLATKENSNFYLGLDDVTVFRGKKDDMEQIGQSKRYFTSKFHKDPKRAAELVFFNQIYLTDSAKERSYSYDPEIRADFWKKVHYDPKQKTYIYEELLTIGTRLPPKQCQLERFYRGEYEFIKLRHEIQILKTELVKV